MIPTNKALVFSLCIVSIYAQVLLTVFLLTEQGGAIWTTSFYIVLILALGGLIFSLNLGLVSLVYSSNKSIHVKWLNAMVHSLSNKVKLRQPQIRVLDTTGINAFALEGLSGPACVLLHAQIFSSLTQDEVEAVLAHEICHIAQGHARILTIVQAMTLGLTLPVALLLSILVALISGSSFRRHLLKLNGLLLLLFFPITSICVRLISRRWEYEADRGAAELVGTPQYLQALRCLHGSFFEHSIFISGSGWFSFNDLGPMLRRLVQPLLNLSHPSLAQRINALQEIGS